MNKSKIILASIGGATLLVSLGLAYLIWSATAERSERLEELDGAVQSAVNLTKLPVYPGPEGIKSYEENGVVYEEWRAEAQKVASVGDRFFEPTTPPALKSFMIEDARRLSALPGGVEGVIVKPEFPFGFKEYVLDGKMPAQEDLARLQREWFDMATVVEALSKSGVLEITDLAIVSGAPAVEEPKSDNRKKRATKQAKVETPETDYDVTRIKVDFRTMPPGLVSAANAFLTARRFMVVDDVTFIRERDEIVAKLGGDGKKGADQQSGGRGRRGRRGRQEEPEEENAEAAVLTGVVTDPQTAPAFKVSMAISVYDFRSADAAKAEAPAETEAPAAAEAPAAEETPVAADAPAEAEAPEKTEEQQ